MGCSHNTFNEIRLNKFDINKKNKVCRGNTIWIKLKKKNRLCSLKIWRGKIRRRRREGGGVFTINTSKCFFMRFISERSWSLSTNIVYNDKNIQYCWYRITQREKKRVGTKLTVILMLLFCTIRCFVYPFYCTAGPVFMLMIKDFF